jgi:hypothetical protein
MAWASRARLSLIIKSVCSPLASALSAKDDTVPLSTDAALEVETITGYRRPQDVTEQARSGGVVPCTGLLA